MQADEQEWIEQALCDAERARCVRKVLSIDRKDVVAKGDNYTSELSRLTLKVVLHSGEIEERVVIYKVVPSTEMRKKVICESGLFVIEKRMYTEVLPLMEKIRKEYESGEPLWGQCYASKGYEAILLEDLQVHGYRMGERRKGLDYNHCCLLMKALAKFHALAAILRARGQLIIRDYDKYFLERNMTMMAMFYKQSFVSLTNAIETQFEPEWQHFAERLRKMADTLVPDLIKSMELDKNNFNTLNHGDCWVNNMLFKYDEAGNPVSTRLIDFQLSFINHVGFDLQYFLSTSIEIDLRPRISEFLDLYHEALCEYLGKFGYPGKIPSKEELRANYDKAALFGLSMSVSLMPLMKIETKDVPDLEEVIKEWDQKGPDNPPAPFLDLSKQEEYLTAIKCVLRDAEKAGTI